MKRFLRRPRPDRLVAAAGARPAPSPPATCSSASSTRPRRSATPTPPFPTLKTLRARSCARRMYWGGKGGVAGKRRPAHPTNPADPAYSWGAYDNMVRAAAKNNIKVLFSIWGTPAWANKSKGLEPRADARARPAQLRLRGGEALQRHLRAVPTTARPDTRSTDSAPGRPPLAGLERAGNPIFLKPQYKRVGTGKKRALGRAEPDRLRAHVRRGLHRRALDAAAQREGRLRRHRAARQQQPVLVARRRSARCRSCAASRRRG